MNKEKRKNIVDELQGCFAYVTDDDLLRENGLMYAENKELKKEIERLNKGYCELKEKCNNGECDCQNEEYYYMCESNMKLSLEVDRLNNIIEELEKELKKDMEVYLCGRNNRKTFRFVEKMVKVYYLNKLKELKEKSDIKC